MSKYQTKRILIWGKTYPELSTKYGETVCTAGCLEDGSPVRIYPVPFRHLKKEEKYKAYQWIEAPIRRRSGKDPRPESYGIRAEKIMSAERIKPDDGWMARRKVIERDTSWHFDTARELKKSQRQSDQSLGIVPVAKVTDVYVEERSPEKEEEHVQKLEAIRSQKDLFQTERTPWLDFQKHRICVRWYCGKTPDNPHSDCNGHDMNILDWGLGELTRREGPEKARQKIESICNPRKNELKFFLGNMQRYPQSFTIVGLWYPKRADVERRSTPLFD